MSRGGHKYSKVRSKGKRCPVKLAFLFHMNDFNFEAQQKPVQDNGSYEGAKIHCLQKLEPGQWQFCDTIRNELYTLFHKINNALY